MNYFKNSVKFLIIGIVFSFNNIIKAQNKPNIILIVCDDLNDVINGYGGFPFAITPNLDVLAQQGVTFSNAACNAPICGPSRGSLFSGLYPHTSGLNGYKQGENNWFDNPTISSVQTMHKFFKDNNFLVAGTGKIYHANKNKSSLQFSDFNTQRTDQGPFPWDGASMNGNKIQPSPHPNRAEPLSIQYADLSEIPTVNGHHGWTNLDTSMFSYIDDSNRDLMSDEISIAYASDFLSQTHTTPFFLTIGIYKPHAPFFVPRKFFDLYDVDSMPILTRLKDLDDQATGLLNNSMGFSTGQSFLENMYAIDGSSKYLKEWMRSYLACVSFVDEQVGVLMSNLNSSQYANNTIVVFTSDHGFQMGEKNTAAHKNTLWSETTRVPLIIKGPGIAQNMVCDHPVSLIDIYPTLTDLALLTPPNHLEGHSLNPFLIDPSTDNWTGDDFSLTAIMPYENNYPLGVPSNKNWQHYSARTKNYKYILTSSNEEELYDVLNDPNEWNNLVGDPLFNQVKLGLRNKVINKVGRRPYFINPNHLYNGNFEDDLTSWRVKALSNFNKYQDSLISPNNKCFYIDVQNNSIGNPMLYSKNFMLRENMNYTVSFDIKGEYSTVRCKLYRDDISAVYKDTTITVQSNWQTHTFSFYCSDQTTNRDAVIEFEFLDKKKTFIDNVFIKGN